MPTPLLRWSFALAVPLALLACGAEDVLTPCSDECLAGTLQCHGPISYLPCDNFDLDNCLEWRAAPETCPAGSYCADGACVPDPDACTGLGLRRCQVGSNAYQVCEQVPDGWPRWSAPVECGAGTFCRNGDCSTCQDACQEGARRCAPGGANATQLCQLGGGGCWEWGNAVACEGGLVCTAGQCIVPETCFDECVAATLSCDGDGWRECGQHDGDTCLDWSDTIACPPQQYCSAGQCSATCTNECSADGQRECYLNGYRRCSNVDSDPCLDWSYSPCPSGESCSLGYCGSPDACSDECGPAGATICSNDLSGTALCANHDADTCLEPGLPTPCPALHTCHLGQCLCDCDYIDTICEPATFGTAQACACDDDCDGGSEACRADSFCDWWCPPGRDPDCAGTCTCDYEPYCEAACNFAYPPAQCPAASASTLTCDCDPDCGWHRSACRRDGWHDPWCPTSGPYADPDQSLPACADYSISWGYLYGDDDEVLLSGTYALPDPKEGGHWVYLAPPNLTSGAAEVLWYFPAEHRACFKELVFSTYGYDDCWGFGAEGAEVSFWDWGAAQYSLQGGSMGDTKQWYYFSSTELDRYLRCGTSYCSFWAKVACGSWQCTHVLYFWLDLRMKAG